MANSMRAVVITEFGDPEVLKVREVHRPEARPPRGPGAGPRLRA